MQVGAYQNFLVGKAQHHEEDFERVLGDPAAYMVASWRGRRSYLIGNLGLRLLGELIAFSMTTVWLTTPRRTSKEDTVRGKLCQLIL